MLTIINKKLSTDEWLVYLKQLEATDELSKGINELEQVVKYMRMFGIGDDYFMIDPTIARGLDYYTGTIYETRLDDYPTLGSICSGGRYANLAGSFIKKNLPGVGISRGLTRLIPKLIEMGILKTQGASVAPVIITMQNFTKVDDYLKLATYLRDNYIKTEVYLQEKNLGMQMKYANKKGFKIAIIADIPELESGNVILKYLQTGEQAMVPITELAEKIKNYL